MKKELAVQLARFIDEFSQSDHQMKYEAAKIPAAEGTLKGFHQWSNGKPLISGYHVQKLGEESYYFLLIDWHRNNNYYLVIYLQNKSTTAAEIQKEENGQELLWNYNPLKRDGLNAERKAFFKQLAGTTAIRISLPQAASQVESFFDQLFTLCRTRLKADRVSDVFDL